MFVIPASDVGSIESGEGSEKRNNNSITYRGERSQS